MDLFLDKPFKKEAAFAFRVSDTPENWPQELTSELLKQLPFLSDYDVNVNLDRVEPQRGFAFGYADVANKTERPELEHDESGMPHIRIPIVIQEKAVKPFSIFLDGEKVMPLTEERVRQVLFNPQAFDLSTVQPRDPSLVESLMPPMRSGMGMGGEYKTASMKPVTSYEGSSGVADVVDMWLEELKEHSKLPIRLEKEAMIKEAFGHISKPQWQALYQNPKIQQTIERTGSAGHPEVINAVYELASKMYGYHPKTGHKTDIKKEHEKKQQEMKKKREAMGKPGDKPQQKTASLLEAIATTISDKDAESFIAKLASNPSIQVGLARSGIAPKLIEVFDNTKRASADERLSVLAENISPTVITVQKLPGGDFLVKSANVNAFSPQEAQGQIVPGQEAQEAMGPSAQEMTPGQSATAVSEPIDAPEPPNPSKAKVIDEFGQFKVQDAMGNSLLGHVFPTTLAWDGDFSPQPIALFTNGSAYALQEEVAGEMVGKGTNLPSDEPRGDGCFYTVNGGEAVATAPITVGSSGVGPDGLKRFTGTDIFGNQLNVVQVEGLKAPQRISDSEYGFPDNWKFMRLNNQTQLIPDPMQMNKMANAGLEKTAVTMFYNGGYNLVGGCGLDKLATSFTQDLDSVSAEFMLGLLGVDGAVAKFKVAEARKKGPVKLANLKTITLLSERYKEAEKTASKLLENIPNLKRDLIKEAAQLEDEGTVDNILALNFINPENLSTFVSYIPEMEECSEKLAEMLMFSYLGMKELPEGAIDRSLKNMEEVITQLKAVASE